MENINELFPILLFGCVVLATHFLDGITGFGCTVLAMPFSIMLLGVETARPVLTFYALLLALYLAARYRKSISREHFIKMIIAMLLGLPIGILAYNYLPKNILLTGLSIFIILVSARGILNAFGFLNKSKPIKDYIALPLVFIGGIIHGALSSGGPLVIIYATEKIKDKSEFRSTLCLIWLTLNTLLIAQMLFNGQIDSRAVITAEAALPFLVAGALLGDYAHKHIRDTVFTKLTFIVLLLAGIFMMI